MRVSVVEMTLGTTIWCWLCESCQTARRRAGWTVKKHQAIAFGCDDHNRMKEPRNEPLDYVLTPENEQTD